MQEQIELLKDKVSKAQKILIGIGAEWEDNGFEQSEAYKCYERKAQGASEQWLLPFLKAFYLKSVPADNQLRLAYENLKELLDGKDYFVVTLQNDGRVYDSGLESKRIVSPCGDYGFMQCSDNCRGTVQEAGEVVERIAKDVLESGKPLDDIKQPICTECGKKMMLNLHPHDKYCEEGYMKQWQEYQKWFAGTLNRQILLLELGAGFVLPNIIRWPFEKTAYLNQKAFLCRIHQDLWQLSEEVGQKGCSIKEHSVKFMANL